METDKNRTIWLETARKYADIIGMERPQTAESLRRHPRMTLQNRAKIFSPFAALRGYEEQLAEEKQRTERVPKKMLTEEEMSALSDRLMQVRKGMTITVQYFEEDRCSRRFLRLAGTLWFRERWKGSIRCSVACRSAER